MNKQTIALLRTSFAEIARRRPDVAAVFYKRLFEVAPDLRPMYSPSLKEQQKKLKASMAQLAQSEQLPDQLAWLGERHADDGLKPAHYKIAGDTLLWTFQHALQQNFTKPIRAAWAEAYNIVAKKMVAADARDKVKRAPVEPAAVSGDARKPVVRRVKRAAVKTAAESGKRKAARRPARKPARRATRAK
jgi:hemoglobin-like flavoprotein